MLKELETRLDAIESRFAIDALVANYAEAFNAMNGNATPLKDWVPMTGIQRFGLPA